MNIYGKVEHLLINLWALMTEYRDPGIQAQDKFEWVKLSS